VGATLTKRAYTYRFYPTEDQARELLRTFGCIRLVYNKALEARTATWQSERRHLGYGNTSAMLTGWKPSSDLAFLSEVSSVPLQQTLRHLQKAFTAFWDKRACYPRFNSRKRGKAGAEYTRSGFRWRDGQLWLAKMDRPLAIVWSSWSEFRSTLEYKAAWYGRTVIAIDRWYPSSKTCAECGYLLETLPLNVRQWTCPGCSFVHDRDVNASRAILAAGRADTACGDGVRPIRR
jgi:transposase